MSSTNKTPNYELPQYVSNDVPSWLSDVNNAMSVIDMALHTIKVLADGAQSTADGIGDSVDTINQSIVAINNSMTTIQQSITTLNNSLTSVIDWTELTVSNGTKTVCKYRLFPDGTVDVLINVTGIASGANIEICTLPLGSRVRNSYGKAFMPIGTVNTNASYYYNVNANGTITVSCPSACSIMEHIRFSTR